MSQLGNIYDKVYGILCGRHPNVWPWHFQWLALKYLHDDLREILPQMKGRVLDLGCGGQPYREWFGSETEYVGADISLGSGAEVLLVPGQPLPFPDDSFDVVLCTQVLEHVEDAGGLIVEVQRILKPGGCVVATVPFMFNEHGAPHDYRRLSQFGLQELFKGNEVESVRLQGGIGSSLVTLALNWIETQCNQNRWGRIGKGILLPVWIIFSLLANMIGAGLDCLDTTKAFYNNSLMVSRKPSQLD